MNEVVPSASVVLPGVQVKVSAEVGLVGVRLTEAKTGAVLPIVIEVDFVAPVALPSLGVAVQVTESPPTNAPAKVAPLPAATPSTVQAKVLASASPSGSEKPVTAQVKVLLTVAELGEIVTPVMLGAPLPTVTEAEDTAAPSSRPSVGVTAQEIVSPLVQKLDPKVLVVVEISTPFTVQAYS